MRRNSFGVRAASSSTRWSDNHNRFGSRAKPTLRHQRFDGLANDHTVRSALRVEQFSVVRDAEQRVDRRGDVFRRHGIAAGIRYEAWSVSEGRRPAYLSFVRR